ncbi:hypothetical protein H112_05671 [Trichophyton rubrum D6]|uniref:Uncharacterized protein n=3 Tax=Trichophyton rubrum TaxID=5551 RepID=A0A178EQF6_TRIRU|nr:uncharacterized protein TERG_03392 [Trichophyton rubrum CBS 118892]EZF16219.1 hypothetical protein H100_05688 [Trichophyton rubrum MR850]EZF40356.1 hypothetical protein H102_05657 [Trichophyton rubrum CBS 100081]EZF50861.1 hypothetical protein H103_05684 [Trichophyton rubrum CBS 288.86]EZF61579.1 hypothetical protein H104_05669 [Trichophyton rubrum CBS 289.86]EZF83001.1 hypothetical protein H110_05679 [Trichophyton rubrum MR1448]EZF93546.1 hypothetical protein H113_05724 [Trichophyton rubr
MSVVIHEDEDCRQAGGSPSVAPNTSSNTDFPLTKWDLQECPTPDVGPGGHFEWRLKRAAERAEAWHRDDMDTLPSLSRTEIIYIRNMLLRLIRKLYLKEDADISVSQLMDFAESTSFDELNDYPVPSRYWQSIRGIRDYYRYDGQNLPEPYDTACHFAWHMAQEAKDTLRRRWADAFQLAYGFPFDEVASKGNPSGGLPGAPGLFD